MKNSDSPATQSEGVLRQHSSSSSSGATSRKEDKRSVFWSLAVIITSAPFRALIRSISPGCSEGGIYSSPFLSCDNTSFVPVIRPSVHSFSSAYLIFPFLLTHVLPYAFLSCLTYQRQLNWLNENKWATRMAKKMWISAEVHLISSEDVLSSSREQWDTLSYANGCIKVLSYYV